MLCRDGYFLATADQIAGLVKASMDADGAIEALQRGGMTCGDFVRRVTGPGSFLRRELERLAGGPVGAGEGRPVVVLYGEDVEDQRPELTPEQVLEVLNSDWDHVSESSVPEAMETIIHEKCRGMFGEAPEEEFPGEGGHGQQT
jgi:hypothetical protein